MKKAWVLSYPLSANEDSDQTGWIPRLTESSLVAHILLVLSCRGLYSVFFFKKAKMSHKSEMAGPFIWGDTIINKQSEMAGPFISGDTIINKQKWLALSLGVTL